MNVHTPSESDAYAIDIQPLSGRVTARRGDEILATSTRAKVMYETRLPPAIYFPPEDVVAQLGGPTALQTFCPFKGTASYRDLILPDERIGNAVWSYRDALPESEEIRGYVAFMARAGVEIDIGPNDLRDGVAGNLSGPFIDWLLRDAARLPSPETFTQALAEKLQEQGVVISRLSVMIWSLHPLIVGKNYVWNRGEDEVTTFAPSYEMHDHPNFQASPLRHVAQGLGGVRQKIGTDYRDNSFPIIEDLREMGATDYVAMPLTFSDGRRHVLTMTTDHPDGFSTANLGLVFECSQVISRYYEVFLQKENARTLLETYLGRRTGARVLGGEIRRGDGDEIDAAIMFCDLRNSTALEERLGRDAYITQLNEFFEVTTDIVRENGGEVLKFIGDAVLAVFPAGDDSDVARAQARQSARQIAVTLAGEGENPCTYPCDFAIGIAYGRVTYGNVGSRDRLDFTVIGQAANIAARLADHAKQAGRRVVATRNITGDPPEGDSLGELRLRNVSRPVEAFALPVEGASHRDVIAG